MRTFSLLFISGLIASTLAACIGTNKAKQNTAIYDFGLSVSSESNQQIASKILFEQPVAAESLNHNKIRYRLNYQDPSRVFFYAESRWAAAPPELLSGKLSKMVNLTNNPMKCSLELKIEAFDHVFQTTTASEGVVQLSALLIEKKSRKVIATQLITESAASVSPNAQGGTDALHQASENALKKVIQWGNLIANNSEFCQ
jgi:cholesterol transport system auxiliary component